MCRKRPSGFSLNDQSLGAGWPVPPRLASKGQEKWIKCKAHGWGLQALVASLSTMPGPAPGNQGEHAPLWWAVVFLTLQSPQRSGSAGPPVGWPSLCSHPGRYSRRHSGSWERPV